MTKQMCCQSPVVSWTQGQPVEEGQFVLSCTGCGTIWGPAKPELPSQAVITGMEVLGDGNLEVRVRNIEAILGDRDLSKEIQDASAGLDNGYGDYRLAWIELSKKIAETTSTTWTRKRLISTVTGIGTEHGIPAEAPAE